ncbi:MAG: hypothetical protein ABJK28_07615 [Algibacter sp.]
MGLNGTKLAYSATLIKLSPKNKFQTIILELNPSSACDKNYYGKDILGLSSKYHRNKTIKKEIDDIGLNDLTQEVYWSKAYNGNIIGIIKNYFFPKYNYKNYYGYDPIFVSYEEKQRFKKYLNLLHEKDCDSNQVINPIYIKYLKDIKLFCELNNKKLILVTSPILGDLCKKDNQIFTKFVQDTGFQYYDFTDLFSNNKNTIDLWKDTHHLSNKGAELFTKHLKEKVLK